MLLQMLILVGAVVVLVFLIVLLFKTESAIKLAGSSQHEEREFEQKAKELVQPGGDRKTLWFYDYRGDDPFIDNYGSSSGGHGNRRWQFDCYDGDHFWFVQYEFSKFPYTEESLQQAFSDGTLVPEGDAPTDLDILRSVEGRP